MNGITWRRVGKVFDPAVHGVGGFMAEFAQAPHALVRDDHVRVYFSCRPKPRDGQYVSHSAWVDLDRRDLTRVLRVASEPILGLGARGTFDEFGTYPVSVIERRGELLCYYGGWTRCVSTPFDVAIGLARGDLSGDRFERIGPGPVLAAGPHEPFVLSGPKIRSFGGRLVLFYIAGTHWVEDRGRVDPVYRLRMATSDDGVRWERTGRDLVPPVLGPDEAQASPDVIFHGDRYHLYFCYREGVGFREPGRGYRLGYAWSKDLEHWHRDDAAVGIGLAGEGWDSGSMSYPHVFELDGRLNLLYLGDQVGRHGFGLAVAEPANGGVSC